MSNNGKKMKEEFGKLGGAVNALLRTLRIRPLAGGLEVTDQLLRLAYFDGSAWQFRAVRIEPGVCEGGRINDEEAFRAALLGLRAQIPELARKNSTMNLVVSLGATSMYNQIISLPLIKGESFRTAVKLNLQMSSPVDMAQVYSGWEVISRNEGTGRAEVLGAFADRAIVDRMTKDLFAAGFTTVAVESKAFSVARMVREYGPGFDPAKSYLIAIIDDSGLDFLIVRSGQLCFEYMKPWQDIAGEKGEITVEKFTQVFTLGFRQVLNFYRQHWQDPVASIGLSGTSLIDESRAAIGAMESIPIFLLEDALGHTVPDTWVGAFGAGLRGIAPRGKDKEITFLGEGAKALFENSRVVDFLSFWRVAVPIVFSVLFIVFVFADIFLNTIERGVNVVSTSITSAEQNTKQAMTDLVAQATAFNNSVAIVSSTEQAVNPRYEIIDAIAAAAAQNNIVLTRVTLQSDQNPILVVGTAQSEESILSFESAVGRVPGFGAVNLPLAGIQGSGTSYSFSMSFSETK
ncbi:MAG: hypothetical protein WCF77_04000 [Minisyncoccia bacterium]